MAKAVKTKSKKPGIIAVLVGLVGAAALFVGSIRGCGGFGKGDGEGDGTKEVQEAAPQSKLFVTVRVKKEAYYMDGSDKPLTLEALLKEVKASGKKVKIIYNKGSYATSVDKLESALKAKGIHPVTEREQPQKPATMK